MSYHTLELADPLSASEIRKHSPRYSIIPQIIHRLVAIEFLLRTWQKKSIIFFIKIRFNALFRRCVFLLVTQSIKYHLRTSKSTYKKKPIKNEFWKKHHQTSFRSNFLAFIQPRFYDITSIITWLNRLRMMFCIRDASLNNGTYLPIKCMEIRYLLARMDEKKKSHRK